MYSNTKYKFNCDACPHPFKTALNDIVNGSWCPTCKNKTEKLVLEFVQNLFLKKKCETTIQARKSEKRSPITI
jgi:Zn finger protein HypA/HybF involved in hydrogenase expression